MTTTGGSSPGCSTRLGYGLLIAAVVLVLRVLVVIFRRTGRL
jgi:hypothetical protein